LEVVATEPTGDVHTFADEMQAGDGFGFQRFLRQAVCRHAAAGDFSLGIAFAAVRVETPCVHARACLGELAVGLVGKIAVQCQLPRQRLCQPPRHMPFERRTQGCARVGAFGGGEQGGSIGIGQEIDIDHLSVRPIAAGLQDGGARQSAVGEQSRLAKRRFTCACDHLCRYARKLAEQHIFPAQRQRHQRRARLDNFQPELAGEIIGKACRAHFGDARPARRNDQARRGCGKIAIGNDKARNAMRHRAHIEPEGKIDAATLPRRPVAFVHQHRDNLPRAAITEKLTQRLFVKGDTMRAHQIDEILRFVTPQRRFGEMRVGRDIAFLRVLAGRVDIGEIAPPAARNQDFLPRSACMVDHQHLPPALPRRRGAHQPRSARAQYDGIVISGFHPTPLAWHSRNMKKFIALLALGALAAPATANDSSAAIGLGGLELTQNDAISMDREDLFLSRQLVTVKYRFTNKSNSDVKTLVSFPLPPLPNGIDGYIDAPSFSDWREQLEFRTLVDGEPAELGYREVVTLVGKADAKGVEARLQALGWPIKHWDDYEFDQKYLAKLTPAEKDSLVAEGLLRKEPDSDYYAPNWQIQAHVTREQLFPAGKTISVEHSYKPIAGGSVGGMLTAEFRKETEYFGEYQAAYCIDNAFLKGFDKRFNAERARAKARGDDYGVAYVEHWLDYVLKSGANWKGPIKDFRLVVDKEKPNNLVSFCMDGVKKIGPTRFEVRKSNFEPNRDIQILIAEFYDPNAL
jgi:hypothetical protein